MELEIIISFLGAAFLLAIMPGPDNIFVLTESLTKGKSNGIAIAAGLSLGVIVHTTLVVTGVALLLRDSELAFTVVKYAGALYLLYLAIMSIREKPLTIDEGEVKTLPNNYFKLIRKGFLMNVLNPKVTLFFIAFLPQFVKPNGFSAEVQMLILGAIFMVNAFVVFSLIAILANRFTEMLNNPKFWNITKWCKAVVLLILAVVVVL